MMRCFIFLSLISLLISCDTENNVESPAQNYFVKFYGEDGNHEGVDVVLNSDGSFILLGNERISTTLGQQIYVVKVDPFGMVLWQRSFGITGDEFARDVELTAEGNIIIAGESQKGVDDRDVFIKVISQDGMPLDSVRVDQLLKTNDGSESDEEVLSITVIQDGYIISGSTTAVQTDKSVKPNDTRDALHLRFTNALDIIDESTGLWNYTSGLDDSEDVLIKIIQVNTTTFYGFGYTNTIRNSSSDYKYWAFSLGATGEATNNGTDLLDAMGDPQENEKLSGVAESPLQSGEGFVLSGIKVPVGGVESQSFIVKLQKDLFVPGEDNVLVQASPTKMGNNVGGQTRMTPLASGGFLLLTDSGLPSNDNLNISLIKLDNRFEKVWQESIFFGGVGDDFSGSVKELPDGKIIITGTMTLGRGTGQTKMVLMKLNSAGRFSE